MASNRRTFARFNLDFVEMDCTKRLADVLQISEVEAAGYIALLIVFGIQKADNKGCINEYTARTIENACHWPKNRRMELIGAFWDAGVVIGQPDDDDDPLTIAPDLWFTQAADVAEKREKDRNRKRAERAAATDS